MLLNLTKVSDAGPTSSSPAFAALAPPHRRRSRHGLAAVSRRNRLFARARPQPSLHAVPAEELRDDAERQHLLPRLLLPRRLLAGEPHWPALVHARNGARVAA